MFSAPVYVDEGDLPQDLQGYGLFASQLPWMLKMSACAVGAVALRAVTTSAYGLVLGRNTSEVPLFLAVDDDDLAANDTGDRAHEFSATDTFQHHDAVLAPVTDSPRGRRAPAAATAAAATDRLVDALFAARPASAALRPVTGAWEAQRLPDAWPATDGAEGGGDGNEDQEPTDELTASYLAVLSWLWVSLQDLLARLKAFLISDLEDTWASLRGDMVLVLVLPWITEALDLVFDQLSTMWMHLESSACGAPVLAVVVIACVVFWIFLRVCRMERRSASIKYHMMEREMQDAVARAHEDLREEFRRELDARDRDAARNDKQKKASSGSEAELLTRQQRPREKPEATAADDGGDEKDEDRAGGNKQGESKKRRGKKMHRAGRKHRKRSILPKDDIAGGGWGGGEG